MGRHGSLPMPTGRPASFEEINKLESTDTETGGRGSGGSASDGIQPDFSWADDISDTLDIPEWVPFIGGGRFGFNIQQAPQIPHLAHGAVIPPNAPSMAVPGDQRSGNNIEAPESLIRKIVREETRGMSSRRVEELLERLISTVEGIEVGEETIGRAAARYNRVAERARGY